MKTIMGVNTFNSYSFGCRVNEAEREEIDRKMIASGFVYEKKNPDYFLINTCAVTHKAEREARQLIFKTKKELPKTKIIVTGCSATYWKKNNLYKDLPVDMIVDNINKEFLVELIKKRLSNKTNLTNITNETNTTHKSNWSNLVNKFIDSGRIMIKIQDGCQRFCTFCIVPYLRGMPQSNKIKDIVKKINSLKKEKVSEVILTAINTEAFGYDSKESFVDLLKSVINKTKVKRISLGSVHPWSINDELFKFYKEYLPKNRLVNFFHVPLQSGSNKILNLMKRGYTREEMMTKLNTLAKMNSFALIATDVIVGFLEESDTDFEDTFNFLKDSPINKFHIFRFSKRTKTAADYMSKRLDEPSAKIKIQRAKRLAILGKLKYESFLKKNVGRVSAALFLEKRFEDFQEALLDNQLPVYIKSDIKPGKILDVKIIGYKKGKLFGKIV